jgi:hypothetical protein
VVVVLWAVSEDIREQPGSFLRQYPPHPVKEEKQIKLPDDHFYFAGATGEKIYLANRLTPLYLLEIQNNMSDTSVVKLTIENIEKQRYFRITVTIDSPFFYFLDGAMPYIYRGNIGSWNGRPFMEDSVYFVDAIPISNQSFAVRGTSARTGEHVLGKMKINSTVKLNHELLEKQFDGIFCTDGVLRFNKELSKLIYMYHYRNQYIVTDTNLNLIFRGTTIDTFKTAHITSAKVASQSALKLSSPPLITNKIHGSYKNWLFINSLLPAKNEYLDQFDKASVIDVYDLKTQSYQFSFYAFGQNGEKLTDLLATRDKLYVLFRTSIKSYTLTEKYFPETPL